MTDPDATGILAAFVSTDGTSGASAVRWVGDNDYGAPFGLTCLQWIEFDDGSISTMTMCRESQNVWKWISAQPGS